MMQGLYRLEHLMRLFQMSAVGKKELRQRIALPLLNEMFDWMNEKIQPFTPSSPIYKALNYSLKLKKELMVYTENSKLHSDNNHVENKIRPVAIGRKNYIFMGSHTSAQRSAMLYSFFLSCKLNNINPEEWLEYVLLRINNPKASELHNLLPIRGKKA